VTAFTLDDALSILDQELFAESPRPPLRRVGEEVESGQLHELAREAGLPSWLPEGDAQRLQRCFAGSGSHSLVTVQPVNETKISIVVAMPRRSRSDLAARGDGPLDQSSGNTGPGYEPQETGARK
jgi:hypothetical protein